MTEQNLSSSNIVLEGVRVHNLKNFNLQIARNLLTVICGVSGSGKSSLAFDVLFAEGQRRYVETFSPYARQFLDRIERPDVDRIEGIPPAIAIRQNARTNSARSTIGTRTEIVDYLRILFAEAGDVVCPECDLPAVRMTADSATEFLLKVGEGWRAMLVFDPVDQEDTSVAERLEQQRRHGFARCIINGVSLSIDDVLAARPDRCDSPDYKVSVQIIADRIRLDRSAAGRIAESLEQIFAVADGRCAALVEAGVTTESSASTASATVIVDGKQWQVVPLSVRLMCRQCGHEFETATPEMLNFQSPLGACPTCEGTGQVSGMSFDRVVPDTSLSLQDGAIRPWTTPAYRHELDELLALAADFDLPVNVPFAELTSRHRQLIHDGVPECRFGGLTGFHRWLVRNRYKQGVSVWLNRWRSWLDCPDCHGSRLIASAGCVKLRGLTITTAAQQELDQLAEWVDAVVADLSDEMQSALSSVVAQLTSRLRFLNDCGLSYLSLDRSMRTLSGGEAQRVVLTSALGSGLINTLYVLDEPTSGLHPNDAAKVIAAARQLQRLGNTVVVVEHDPDFIRAADLIVEIGPAAGAAGGNVVFQGTPAELIHTAQTATATGLTDLDASSHTISRPRRTPSRWLSFVGVRCHNICDLSGRLPLDVICVVTGVSGSGKSSLIVDALYPAICQKLGQPCAVEADGVVAELTGVEQIADICLLDQSPLRGSSRSIPATMIGCFDDIRKVLADTHEARKRNYRAGTFSFNSAKGGRCPDCEGRGVVTVEMQFLADIQTTCEACHGRRFRPDVLEVRHRNRNIDDILQMTADDAFLFFNGQQRIQQRLNALRQAGLGYLCIGQPVSTLSGGEAQRLRIAALLAGVPLADESVPVPTSRSTTAAAATLFVLDEPSTGLHLRDISALMKCLNHLVEIGHSVIVIEHDPQVVRHCDVVVELGPGPGRHGGRIVSAAD
ncbi:MAG: excinuclease ABC subunit UvrA [Planctomycetaceae bacterium]